MAADTNSVLGATLLGTVDLLGVLVDNAQIRPVHARAIVERMGRRFGDDSLADLLRRGSRRFIAYKPRKGKRRL